MISGNNLRYYPTLKKKNLIASDKFCFKTKLNISTHDDLRKKKKKKLVLWEQEEDLIRFVILEQVVAHSTLNQMHMYINV